MDVKTEIDMADHGESIERHNLGTNSIDTFNIYSMVYCIVIATCVLTILWKVASLWIRTKPIKKE